MNKDERLFRVVYAIVGTALLTNLMWILPSAVARGGRSVVCSVVFATAGLLMVAMAAFATWPVDRH